MNSFDRRVLFVAGGLAALLAIVILLGSQVGMPAPLLLSENGLTGAMGPVRLVFAEPMDHSSVESRFATVPSLAGQYIWSKGSGQEEVFSFWPAQPLMPGETLSVRMAAGASAQSGRKLREEQIWEITIREAEILFLSPIDRPEIWHAAGAGQAPSQLTFTDGTVFDFQVSPDGSRIIYSAKNSDNGLDLWELSRDGSQPELLLPCKRDWCNNPAYSPDGERIVYSRRRSGIMPGEAPGVPRLWILYKGTMETEALYADPNIGGFEPAWSPDGRFLAFFDGLSGGVRVLNIDQATDFLLPSQMGMTGRWSPDSRRLLFTNYGETDSGPYIGVFQVDVLTQQIRRILEKSVDMMDYSLPDWTPGGQQVAVALRPMNGAPGKQILIMDLEGNQFAAVTQDVEYNHASYHWDPSGRFLLFQRLKLNSSDQRPEIVLWEQASGELWVIAEDAYLPLWLP